ncbi:HNH endonuclease signature motif containing protein [Jiangella alkaliphila]|uniref:HNH endonuclease signature motif containing protein n=1 Tax=Jiangella alkaliphila TaxID=419479 RepID=UPI00128B957F|nr:HNH endonuclease signature motif containing protein [Jiangella alkaliphila]
MSDPIDRLAAAPPGAELAALLACVDPAVLSAHDLIVVAVARQRQLAHEEAALLRVFAELAARPEYSRCDAPEDLGSGHAHRAAQAAGDEVSLALRWSPGRATGRVALAVELLEDLPDTFDALAAGRIDADKARLIAERTRCLADLASRRRVEQTVLPVAQTRTRWALDQRLRREVIAADPAGAEERRRRSAEHRHVGRPEPASPGGEDGMATLTLYGPAEDVTALWIATDAAARHTRTSGDPRTLDQLRFDLLTGLAWTALESGHLGCCSPHRTTGAGKPAEQRHDDPPSTPAYAAAPHHAGTGGAAAGPVELGRRRGRAAAVHVVVPAGAYLGHDDVPGELDGYGPITATAVRRITADATLRRLLTDPSDGRLLDYGRTTYAPPADLAAHVIARDRTCRFPTCHRPATEAEIDHLVPYAHGGTTDPDNTWALHDGHHRAKTWHGYRIVTDLASVTWWITPAGHRYRVEPKVVGPIHTRSPERRPPERRPAGDAHPEPVPF